MGTYASIVLLLLKIANAFATHLQQQKYFDYGYQKALGETSAEILKKSIFAKKIMEQMAAKNSDQVDATLKGLEP